MGKFTEYKLKKQADTNSATKYRQFREREIENQASQYIVEQLKNYENSNSKFVQSYNDRFFDSDGKYISDKYRRNTQVELLFANKEKERLEKQRQELISLLDSYGSNFKEDWLQETQNYLNDAGNVYDKIIKTYSDDNDLFSQFENADEFYDWSEKQKQKETLRNTDIDSVKTEISDLTNALNNILSIEGQKSLLVNQYDNLMYSSNQYPSAEGQTELNAIKAELDAFDKKQKELEGVFGSSSDIKKKLEELNKTYSNAKELQETEALTTDALNAPDFEDVAQQGLNIENPTWLESKGSLNILGWQPFAKEVKNKYTFAKSTEGEANNIAASTHYNLMTEQEGKVYSYWLMKDSKKAEQYLASLEDVLNQRSAGKYMEEYGNDQNLAADYIFGFAAGADQFSTGFENLFSDKEYYNTNSMQYTSGAIRDKLADDGFEILGSSIGQVGYDLFNTTGNMMPSILASTAAGAINPVLGQATGSALMGASAKGNAYAEMINLGYNPEQASRYSTLVGASEAGLQFLLGGIGKLGGSVSSKAISSAVSKIDNVFARTAIQLGGNMLSEGTEEYLQEVLDPFFKNIAFGEDNDIRFISEDALYSGLLGALSAGMLEGGSVISSNINTYKTGKQLKAAGVTAEQLSELGSKLSINSEAYKLAGRINENTGAYTIGRMFNALNAEITAQNKAEIKEALRTKCINPVSANSIANWMERVVAGEELTAKQKAALENNPVLGEVMRDVLYERNTTALQRQAGLDSIRSQLEEYQIKQALDKAVKKAEKKKAKNAANNKADTQDTQNTAQQAETEDFEAETDTSLAESEKANEANPRVSDNGRTFSTKTGEDLDIVGIASVKDKTFKTADGQTVDSKDVSFATENEAVLYDSVLSMDLPTEIANAIIDGYIPSNNISVTDYLLGSNLAYRYGYAGAKDIELMLDSDVRNIPEHLSKGLYNLGRETAKAEASKEQAEIDEKKAQKSDNKTKKKGRVTFDGKELSKEFEDSLTDIQRESIKGIKVIAEVLGNDVNLFASYIAKEGQYKGKRVYKDSNGNVKLAPNGFYNPDGSINLDINSGNLGEGTILYTLSHELTHHIRKWSPAKFKVLADFVVEQYSDNGIKINDLVYEQMAKAKKNGKSISYGTAYEEVIADACSTMLLDSNAIEKLAQKDKTLFEKIKSFIKDFIDKINKLYKNFSPDAKEAQYVRDIKGMTDKLQALWFEGLEDAAETYGKIEAESLNHTELKYELRKDEYGKTFVSVDENAMDLNNGRSIAENINLILKNFNNIIDVKGQKIRINKTTNGEWRVGSAARKLLETDRQAYNDKIKAIANADDILKAANKWVGEKVKHTRKDDIVEFARGNVRYKVANNGYIADVLVAIKKDGSAVLYELVDIVATKITELSSYQGKKSPRRHDSSVTKETIPQNSESSQGKFSLRESVEETKDLVAVHNLSEEKLLKSLQLGGLPMPSIAIIRAKEGHENFGTISLVFGKETIDPQFFRSNKVFSGDAWTPTYPRVEYKIDENVVEKGVDEVERLIKSRGFGKDDFGYLSSISEDSFKYGNTDEVANKTALQVAYLIDKGIDFNPVYKEGQLSDFGRFDNFVVKHIAEALGKERIVELHNNSEGVKSAVEEIRNLASKYKANKYKDNEKLFAELSKNPFYGENNFGFSQAHEIVEGAYKYFNNGSRTKIDEWGTKNEIADLIDKTDYKKWVNNLFDGFVAKEGIRNNKDLFTPSGNRRSFEALHYEHNLENVIKAMKEEGTKGVGAFGGGNIFGASTTEFSSIADIKNSAEKRLQSLSDEEFSEIKKGFVDRFFELASSLPNNKDSFTATDDAANVLVEAISKYKTKSGIANYIRRECQGWATYSDYVVDDLIELVSDIQQMPTKYFEAKPQRAVGFDEVKAVVIPDNSSDELKSALKSKSFNVLEYQSGNEQDRAAILNSIEDVKFSDRDSDGNTLSKEQQEYFRDSKVRDKNGNLLVVYHGTRKADFTVFKRNINFFTNNKEMAESYAPDSEMYTGYLNIVNPYVIDAKGEKWSRIPIDSETKNILDKYGASTFKEGGKWRTTPADIASAIEEGIDDGEFDYDGIIVRNVDDTGSYYKSKNNIIANDYITFGSKQFKNIDNKAPTSDPDIRFSDRNLYTYESITSKPDMEITILDSVIPKNRADAVAQAKQKAAAVGKINKDGSVSVYVKDVNGDVILSKKGLLHGLDRRFAELAPITVKAGEIIKNSIKINEVTPSKQEADASYILIGVAQNFKGELCVVRSVINKFSNELDAFDVLYAINAKKSTAVLDAPLVSTPNYRTTISIAQLLNFVEKYFPDILPESVLRHYGYNERPEGQIGKNALYSDRDPDGGFSNRYLLANALESTAKTAEDKKKLVEYKAKLGKLSEVQQRLQDVNAKIKEISFGKGKRDKVKLAELQKTSKELNDLINRYDKKLFNLESTESLKRVLEHEKKTAYKKAAQEGKEALADYQEKAKQREKDIRTKYQESRQKSIEGREKTAMRHKIQRVIMELDGMLRHGTKEKNVKVGLQKVVADAVQAINADTVKLESLRKAYADIRYGKSENVPAYYMEEAAQIEQKIDEVIDLVGDTPMSKMSLEQLNSVYNMYRMVLTTVRNVNKVFRENKLEDLRVNAEAVMTELNKIPKLKEERTKAFELLRKFSWDEMIPIYAFERLGSDTLKKFFWDTIKAQNVLAEDVNEAKTFADAVREKYNYKKWNRSKIYKFELNDGRTFRMTLGHMMSIYAYSKRKQAIAHMSTGGFFFNDSSTFRKKGGVLDVIKSTEEGYKVNADLLAKIKEVMPKESIDYVDEMQDYLTKMGEKGNEVSRVIWGIDIFKEKVYFPLKSVRDFVFQSNQPTQEVSLKNDGMTKETKPNASNPIVLEDFDEIWSSHVNRMSQYHAFVVPIDNLNKIHNYGTWAGTSSVAVSTMIKGRFGESANEYISQFIRDLNGGVSMKGATNPFMSLFAKFKKTAVAASASVVIQQPTAIIRATAMIDPKYFAGKPNVHMIKNYEQLKKYAPIAIIKEIGGFDAGAGRQISSWLNSDTLQGFAEANQKIDDVSMLGAAWGDKLGWCAIWDAVKREVKANNKGMDVDSEEFLKKAGKRFTEVIVYTQVYDSTLSRSGFMRSKHDSVKMLTAFMGEPTVSVNMMYNAILQAKRGGKGAKAKAVRTIGAVYLAQIAASAARSAIYALRDDDEEETYLEKFAEAWANDMFGYYGLTGELNPLTQLPAVKDIISIFEGWDVERTDVAVFKDIKDAFDGLFSDNKSTWRKIEDFSGAIASLFGLPVKNILRTGREMYNAVNAIFSDVEGGSFGAAFVRGMTGEKKSKPNKLYDAIVNGDEEMLKILREGYDDDSAYETAVKKALRENDPRIKEAAQAGYDGDVAERVRIAKEIIAEGNFSQDIVVEAINAEVNAIKKKLDPEEDETEDAEEKKSVYSTKDISIALEEGDAALAKEIIADIVSVKVENYMAKDEDLKQKEAEKKAKTSVKSSLSEYWKKLYIEAYNAKDTDEMRRIRFVLKDTGLYGSANDIISTCNTWVRESRKK